MRDRSLVSSVLLCPQIVGQLCIETELRRPDAVLIDTPREPEVIRVLEWASWNQHGIEGGKHVHQLCPDLLAAPFAAVVAVGERKPDGLGAKQGARLPILFATAPHSFPRRLEPGARVPPPGWVPRLGIAREDSDDGDAMAVAGGLKDRSAERKHRVVQMG
jgi:hypothetical protein